MSNVELHALLLGAAREPPLLALVSFPLLLVVSPNAFKAKNCQENIVFPRYLSSEVVDTSLKTKWWTISVPGLRWPKLQFWHDFDLSKTKFFGFT